MKTRVFTHSRILGAAGKGNPTFLSAQISVRTIKVDVQIPVFRSKCPTALPLWKNTRLCILKINTKSIQYIKFFMYQVTQLDI